MLDDDDLLSEAAPPVPSRVEFRPDMAPMLRAAFLDFCSHIHIDSKETGGDSPLELYGAQLRFIDSVFDGLSRDIHWNVVLKARQLGISTVSYAFDLFWLSMFGGLTGALIFETDANKENARLVITRMLDSLPTEYKLPIYRHNRNALILQNGSSLSYLVAGTKKNSGLGRSRGLSFCHASECSSWGDEEGVESLKKSLSQTYPARLFIFESTAKSFNLFYNMWEEAKDDPLVKQATFIGWWAKETYSFPKGSELYRRYAKAPPTAEEQEKLALVKQLYGVDVSMEQLAWYRHERSPKDDGTSGEPELLGNEVFRQELPWDEEEAFITSGVNFFSAKRITDNYKWALKQKYMGFRYFVGEEFSAMVIEPARSASASQLRMWEEPDPNGVYVIGADPAYGSSDKADFYCIQVCRCYSDGLDQVAEFAARSIETYQFAWILAHLCGLYKNARLLLEITGPGTAVLTELRNLQLRLQNGYMPKSHNVTGTLDIFSNVRSYLYHRIDTVGKGSYAFHWQTNASNKAFVYNQLRDTHTIGQLRIRSVACLEQMRRIVQSGISIEGDGTSHDDLPMALAFATHTWLTYERNPLLMQGRTREVELSQESFNTRSSTSMLMGGILESFFASKQAGREAAAVASAMKKWRGR